MSEPNLDLERESTVKVDLDLGPVDKVPLPRVLAWFIFVIGFALISGYIIAQWRSTSSGDGSGPVSNVIPESGIKAGQVFGSPDEETFKDRAVGILKKNENGNQREGTHRLIRDPDNPSQDAYLISSVVDLDKLVDREVEVWGETLYSEKVGWLMDVGRVKVRK